MASILDEIKKVLSIASDDTAFDVDILMHINSIFATLDQLGVGPDGGYAIADKDATWDAFLGSDLDLNMVKTYMYLRVRLIFDPPASSYVVTAMEKQIEQFEWRLSVHREGKVWVEPAPVVDPWDPTCVL